MAKISTYVIDGTIVDGDKVIGSDANNDMITKNYTVGDLTAYMAYSIGTGYLVPYVGAADNVDLGLFGLTANNIFVTNQIGLSGNVGLAGQVLTSQGSGGPATWSYAIGSQTLQNVLLLGNTSTEAIILDNTDATIVLDVKNIYGPSNVFVKDKTTLDEAHLYSDQLTISSPSITKSSSYLSDRIIYTNDLTGDTVTIKTGLYGNNILSYPSGNGPLVLSVNGVGADTTGNIVLTIPPTGVTSVTGSSPISSSGGTTPDISISQASGSSNGFLSSTDWTTFNSKVPSVRTLTINGTSYDLSADRSWTIASGISSVTGVSPISSSGGVNPSISISQASGSSDGYLSSTDWTTFNSKVPSSRTLTINGTSYDLSADRSWTIAAGISGGGTINYLPKWTPDGTTLGDSLIYDNGTSLGVGTTTIDPTYKLQVNGVIRSTVGVNIDTTNVTKTGIYGGSNVIQFWAGSNQLGTYTLVGNIAGASHFTHNLAFNNSAGSGTQNAFRISSNVIDTGANSMIHNQILIDPTYNHGVLGTGLVRGIYYNPTITALNGAQNIAFENVSGDIIHGNLAGVGTRMVVADTTGTLSTQALPTAGGLLNGVASGTDTYTTTISGVTSYADQDAYLIRFTTGNTTGCTLNINGLGARTLYRNNDGALIGGDIVDGAEMLCIYNSTLTGFQVIGTAPNTLLGYVTNGESISITKGQPVYAFSGTGDRMVVKLAYNTSDATSAQTVGIVLSSSIGANQKGLIMMQGLLDGLSVLPTSTWADGDPVYLGATAGTLTNVKPYAPNHLVYLGVVTTASPGAAGRMYVRVQNGYELDELHNVQAQTPTVNDVLYYFGGSPGQWKTASISSVLGYTPVGGTGTANQLAYFTAASTIGSLSTATYPSLTELSYVKGVTSAIQTQINTKVGGSGTIGAIVKFTGTSTVGDATVDVDYMQQSDLLTAYQLMGSKIAGTNLLQPNINISSGGLALQTGILTINAIFIPKTTTIAGVRWFQTVQGSYTANNYNGVGLYYSATVGSSLTLVASSTNDGTCFQQGTGWRSKAFTTPYAAARGIYYVAMLPSWSAVATAPNIIGVAADAAIWATAPNFDFTNGNALYGSVSGQTSLPNPTSLTGYTGNTRRFVLYPYTT